jgi:hypothetical protein
VSGRVTKSSQQKYKRINQAKQRQSREEAEALAFKAANMIREKKGLEQKEAFSLGM